MAKVVVELAPSLDLRIHMRGASNKLVGRARSWRTKGEQLAALYEQVTLQEGKS